MTNPTGKYQYYNNRPSYAHSYLRPVLRKILVNINKNTGFPRKKTYVLDIGCGNGEFCNFLSKIGFNVTGIDNSDTGINIAKENFPEIQFVNKCIYDLSPENLNKKFDIITAVEVIEHLAEPKKLLRKAKEYLHPDGYLIISTPFHGYLKNIFLSLFNIWDKHFTVDWDSGHLRFFSEKTLKSLLKKEGFTNIRFCFAGRYYPLWKSMICISRLSSIDKGI